MFRVGLALTVFGLGFWLVVAILATGWARELNEKKNRGFPRPVSDHRDEGKL